MLSPLSLPDFALIALPSTLPVAVGDDAVFQIDVIPQPGFTGDVALNFATQTSANLLVNPSFEDVTGDLATNWSLAASASTSYSTSIDAAGHSGSAQKITISSPGSWGLYFYQFLNLQLNQTYEWTLWHKTDSLNGIVAEISNSSHTQIVASQSLPGTNGVWQQATISFVYTNSLANTVRIASNTTGDLWLDDFNLRKSMRLPSFRGRFTPSVITGGAGSSVLTLPTVATGSFPFSVVGTSFSLTRLVAMTMEVIDSPISLSMPHRPLWRCSGRRRVPDRCLTPTFTGDVTLTLPALPGVFFNPPVSSAVPVPVSSQFRPSSQVRSRSPSRERAGRSSTRSTSRWMWSILRSMPHHPLWRCSLAKTPCSRSMSRLWTGSTATSP